MGLDTKTYWLTDRQSQCDFDFDFDYDSREKRELDLGGLSVKRIGDRIRESREQSEIQTTVRDSLSRRSPMYELL
jgi:hypothetical protein